MFIVFRASACVINPPQGFILYGIVTDFASTNKHTASTVLEKEKFHTDTIILHLFKKAFKLAPLVLKRLLKQNYEV